MEYKWDKEKLNEIKNGYLELKKRNSKLSSTYILDTLDLDESLDMINEMEDIRYPLKRLLKRLGKSKFSPEDVLNNYDYIPSFVQKWIVNSIQVLRDYDNTLDMQKVPKCNLSTNDCLCLVHDFFNWIPNKCYGQLVDRYLTKNDLLHIKKHKGTEVYGRTYLFDYPYYIPFFLINDDKTINKFITFNHEIAHGIYWASDNFISTHRNHSYLSELEGYLFDYLSKIFLQEKHIVSPEFIYKLEYNDTITAINGIINFYFQYLGVNFFDNLEEIKIETIEQELARQKLNFLINEDSIKDYLQEDSDDLATYATSFLVSLDLEYMARHDLERAFYNFERIRYNKTNNIRHNLTSNGITFMKDGYQNLSNKITKLNLIKK